MNTPKFTCISSKTNCELKMMAISHKKKKKRSFYETYFLIKRFSYYRLPRTSFNRTSLQYCDDVFYNETSGTILRTKTKKKKISNNENEKFYTLTPQEIIHNNFREIRLTHGR